MIEMVIEKIGSLEGNLLKPPYNDVYIVPKNIRKLIDIIKNDKIMVSILITPYLINEENGAICELLYYEQDIEIINNGETNQLNYNIINSLPKEITDNFYPRVNVNKNDYNFLIKYLTHYFNKMDSFQFEEHRASDKSLNEAELYYQIF